MHNACVVSGSLLVVPFTAPMTSALLPTPESPCATTAAVANPTWRVVPLLLRFDRGGWSGFDRRP